MAFDLRSPAFSSGGAIPVKHTCDSPEVSPPLQWSDPPAKTTSFALIVDDPDAPAGTWVHWVLHGLPGTLRELPEGIPPKDTLPGLGTQGVNDFGRVGYGGPCPPRGPAHRYFFKLYALDTLLQLFATATKKEVEAAMKGHILAHAELMGKYEKGKGY